MRALRSLAVVVPLLLMAAALPAQAAAPPMRSTFVTELAANQRKLEQRHDSLDRIADSLEVNYVSAVRLDSIARVVARQARRDSLEAMHLVPQPRTYTPPLPAITTESAMGSSAAVLLWANDRFRFDVDAGGYRDRWRSIDKVTHAALAYGLTDGCSALGGRAFVCAGIVAVGGLAYERTQGAFSSRDAWANLGGAVLSASVNTWLRR